MQASTSSEYAGNGVGDCRTLWIGDVQQNWDEAFVTSIFVQSGMEAPTVKLIRDRVSGYLAGYGFLDFSSHAVAKHILETMQGYDIPNLPGFKLRLNWGAQQGGVRPLGITGSAFDNAMPSVFVGDLANEVNDELLKATFAAHFPSTQGAKVVMDVATGMSKGYGFVRFSSKEEADMAIQTMNGVYCGSRAIVVKSATNKKSGSAAMNYTPTATDVSNTTVYVGGIDPSVTEDAIRAFFQPHGTIVSIKIPMSRGYAFVQFDRHDIAAQVIATLDGSQVGPSVVRLSWGKQSGPNNAAPVYNAYGSYGNQYNAYAYQQQYASYGTGYDSAQYVNGYQQQTPQQYYDGYTSTPQQVASATTNQDQPAAEDDFTKPEDNDALNLKYAESRIKSIVSPGILNQVHYRDNMKDLVFN